MPSPEKFYTFLYGQPCNSDRERGYLEALVDEYRDNKKSFLTDQELAELDKQING